ncbi:MAG: 3-oxoadipate enol-lactonase [Polaromonas sp.]|nr:3-oxoadipate enol-lactonase [Polaromonas sp.]
MSQARLAFRVDGPADAPAVVLIHALATHSELWAFQVPAWAMHLRVIRVDLPGHGLSPMLEGVRSLADFAREIATVLDDLDVNRAALVGLSLGGMVAQAFALAYPARTSALVLAHTSARTDPAVQQIWARRIEQFRDEGLAAQVPSILERWMPRSFAESSPLTLEWIASQIRSTRPEGYQASIEAIQQLDHLDRLKHITAPALVIAGEVDAAAPPATAALMAERLPDARLVVLPGVAHLGNVQQPVLFTETAGSFLLGALRG